MADLPLCPVCGASGGDPAFAEGAHTTVRCPGCGLVHVWPRPAPEEIRAIYEHDGAQTASRQLLAKTLAPHALAHARHTLALLRQARAATGQDGAGTDRLLEIGPGGGLFLREAAAGGFVVHGAEPNPVQAAFIRSQHGLPCTAGAFGPDLLPGTLFHTVYHCNVLSHLPDPVQTFTEIRARLAPGGLHLFETGNYADVAPRFLPLIRRTERFQLPDHLCFFGRRSLSVLLERAGFRLHSLHTYSRVPEKIGPRLLSAVGLSGWARRNRHFLLYGLGAWAIKAGRPQTWIVCAQAAG